QLLPQESMSLVARQRLQEIAGVARVLVIQRVDAMAFGVHALARLSRLDRSHRRGSRNNVRGIHALHRPTLRHVLTVDRQELVDVFKRQLRWVLATPARERRTDRLRRLVARNIVAAKATIAAQRTSTNIFELPASTFTWIVFEVPDEHFLVNFHRTSH